MPDISFEERLKRIETNGEARTYNEANKTVGKSGQPRIHRDDGFMEGDGLLAAVSIAGSLGVGVVYTFDHEMAKPVAMIVLPIVVILAVVLLVRSIRRRGFDGNMHGDVLYDLVDVVKGLLKFIK